MNRDAIGLGAMHWRGAGLRPLNMMLLPSHREALRIAASISLYEEEVFAMNRQKRLGMTKDKTAKMLMRPHSGEIVSGYKYIIAASGQA